MMEQNLSDVMHGFLDAERRAAEAAAPDTTAETHALARRIGRRRAVRGAGVGIASVLVLGGIALGVHALERPEPPLPAGPSPSPSVTAAPAPEPSTPAPTSTPEPPAVTPTAYLTDAVPMPEGTFARTDDSWLMVQHAIFNLGEGPSGPLGLYLIDPGGAVYTVPAPASAQGQDLLDWRPGSAQVLVRAADSNLVQRVDLETGDAITIDAYDGAYFVPDGSGDVVALSSSSDSVQRTDQGGHLVSATSEAADGPWFTTWFLSPSGDSVLVGDLGYGPPWTGTHIYSTTTAIETSLALPYDGRADACRPWGWADEDAVVVQCTVDGTGSVEPWSFDSEFWVVPVDGTAPQRVLTGPEAEDVEGIWRLDGRLLVAHNHPAEATGASWSEIASSGTTTLTDIPSTRVGVEQMREDGLLVVERAPGVDGTASIVVFDPLTGARREVLKVPMAQPNELYSVAPSTLRQVYTFNGE